MTEIKKYKKKIYTVSAMIVPANQTVYNFLENCRYKTSNERNVLITGVVGEQYPVTRKKFEKVYENGTEVTTEQKLFKSKQTSDVYYAAKSDVVKIVRTSWNDALTCHVGDYIVSSTSDLSSDCWVVNALVFDKLYSEI